MTLLTIAYYIVCVLLLVCLLLWMWNGENPNREEALHCANIFNDYFGQFSRIDQYMRDQKMAQIETIPAPLLWYGFRFRYV